MPEPRQPAIVLVTPGKVHVDRGGVQASVPPVPQPPTGAGRGHAPSPPIGGEAPSKGTGDAASGGHVAAARRSPAPPAWVTTAIVLQLLAGLLHLVLTPEHMLEAMGTGLFFLAMGSAQVAWALVRLRHTDRRLDDLGVLLVMSVTVVYVLTRSFASPFTGDHEAIDAFGLFTQSCQAGAIIAVLAAPGSRRSAAHAAALVVAGLLLGLALYGAGLAAEALLPGLGQPHQHSHGG